MAVLGYLAELKRDLGQAFSAHFLHDFVMKMFLLRAYFRKAQHMCVRNRKWHILINSGQPKDETPLIIMLKFLEYETPN